MAIRRNFLIIAVALGVQSCSETLEPDPGSLGIDHFPLEVGNYQDYEVQQINYRFSGEVDTMRFQLRVRVADSFGNEEGGTSFLLNRSIREDSLSPWVLDSVWSSRKTAFQAIQVESNQPLVKLVFPFEEEQTWDGNSLNGKNPDEYRMVNVFQPFATSSGSEEWSNTVTVVQGDFDDGITRTDLRTEVYALDIGLVYKSSRIVEFCADPDCLGQEIIEIGSDLEQRLIDFGNE